MLGKLLALDARERKLLAAGLFWVFAARTLLRAQVVPLPRQQRLLDGLAAILRTLPACSVTCSPNHAAWAVTAAARRVPGTLCLPWALALRGLLAQAGIDAVLRIGVAPAEVGRFKAHAWVECAGRSWTWGDDVDSYSELQPREVAP